jgi:formyl-CoA transferase
VKHRDALVPLLAQRIRLQPARHWADALESAGVPCGPINDIGQAFADPQVQARGMRVDLPHPAAGTVALVASPMRLSRTPPQYRRAPPTLGQHTDEVLTERLGYDKTRIAALRAAGII